MAIKNWISAFLRRHKARFAPHDWPGDGDEHSDECLEFIRGWITAFATKEISESEADEASRQLAATPPNFRREHLPMILATIEANRSRRGDADTASSRDAAALASRQCGYCGGAGLTLVDHIDPAPNEPPTVSAYCTCPHGRWIKRKHAERTPEILRRIPDAADALEGRGPWRLQTLTNVQF